MNQRTRESFYTLWTIAILICLAASVFLLVYVSFAPGGETAENTAPPASEAGEALPDAEGQDPSAAQPAGEQDAAISAPEDSSQPADVTAEPSPAASSTILGETEDMGQEYQDKLVFLGDSTTYGFRAYEVLPKTQVWTPSSGTLSLFNWAVESIEYFDPSTPDTAQSLSIADTAAARKPEYLVITLGINGVSLLDETQFKGYYRDLVQAIQAASPDTKIMCQSIYPVIDGKAPQGITNAGINNANQWILSIAEETGVKYLNTHDSLMDGSGNLISSYDSGDGLHLMPDGLRSILQYVRTHAYQ